MVRVADGRRRIMALQIQSMELILAVSVGVTIGMALLAGNLE